ncbi:MAG: hypothetical protein IJR13_08555 [Bacteroidales bacterium]|nr:hypothetical protein [Bacteroidales bacterium]
MMTFACVVAFAILFLGRLLYGSGWSPLFGTYFQDEAAIRRSNRRRAVLKVVFFLFFPFLLPFWLLKKLLTWLRYGFHRKLDELEDRWRQR